MHIISNFVSYTYVSNACLFYLIDFIGKYEFNSWVFTFNPITFGNFTLLFNWTLAGSTLDSMTVPT